MISVAFLTPPEGGVLGFSMEGHAEYGEAGEDIVCAAVSSAAYLVVNTLTDVPHAAPLVPARGRGPDVFPDRAERRAPLPGPAGRLKLHLTALEEQYPGCLKVGYLEV